MTSTATGLATRSAARIAADPGRVITQLFVPGQEGFERQESRAGIVVKRLLALSDVDVEASLNDVLERFDGRHRDLAGIFYRHAAELADRLDGRPELSHSRKMLLGATFTSEYAIEGAALCNPSIVAHPDQSGVAAGSLRYVMSVRGIGEGHRSTIGFRTGVVDAAGEVTIDEPAPYAATGYVKHALLDAAVFRAELDRLGNAREAAQYVFGALGELFTRSDLNERLDTLRSHSRTRDYAQETIDHIRAIATRCYGIEFPYETELSERVLWPSMEAEQAGMEDARMLRFVDDDGTVSYYGTYTAYSGSLISQQLLETSDFRSFTSTPLVGKAAANKGLALFPRRINGRFAAMSRSDRETNSIAFTDHLSVWPDASPCQRPTESWEVLQLGNCGPPIETDAGWLVLTHGVGPMRTYSIGALLLDLDDPTRVLGRLKRPLLGPIPGEQDGYVPNVVYSCGGLVHADTLVIPYGMCDAAIGMATVPLAQLLEVIVT